MSGSGTEETEAAAAAAAPARPMGASSPAEYFRRRGGFRFTPKRVAILLTGLVAFLAVSLLLARFLQTENVERDEDLELIQAQAKGNAPKMLDLLAGCRQKPACVKVVRADATNPRLLRKGEVKVLQLTSATAYSLTGATGQTRFAWTVIGKLPVVQCIDVRRTGSFLSGIQVHLVGLSAPIQNEADC